MTPDEGLLDDASEDFFENAPCGFLATRPDGTIVRVNRTLESWIGRTRDELIGRRFQELLSPGGRIYHETHYAPLLQMQGSVSEIALEMVRTDGSRLPALVNSVLRRDAAGRPQVVRTAVFDATDRRSYEEELLAARRREQQIAHQLQASMLSGALPRCAAVELDVGYRPAVAGLDVGGDWYDAFWLDEGERLGLVVGDVVGRGIGAAATMGQLRSAVRALASTGLGPARLLESLDEYSRRHDVGSVATVFYAELELGSRRFRHAAAGHLPPAIAGPGMASSFVWEGRSAPLNAFTGRRIPRAEGELVLPPGSSVVLYTDGLVETRSDSLDDGLDRLLRELDEDPGVAAEALLHRLRDTTHADDVCVVSVRLKP